MTIKLNTIKKTVLLLLLSVALADAVQAQTDTARGDTTTLVRNKTEYKNIGFGRQPSNYVTGSVAGVYGSDIDKNFNLNLGNTLYGRLPGLMVQQGGSEPGASVPGLLVRGRNTFGGAIDGPLFIIDGFISNGTGTANAFMQLVPEEIATITVLKDASATAVYGSRAANGVILVTTKAGREGPLKVNLTVKQGYSQAQQLPKFLNSYDYARLYNEARVNDGLAPLYSDADLAAYQSGSDPYYHPDVNWYNEVLRTYAPVSSYDLNFSGGDKTVRYYVVLNALLSGGLYKNFGDEAEESSNSNFSRYNFRSNLDVNLSKRLSAEFKIAGSVEQISNPFEYNTANTFNLLATLPPNAFPVYNPNGTFGGNSTYTAGNPFANLLGTGFAQSNARTILSSLKFIEQLDMLTKGLNVSSAISINNYFKSGSRKSKTYPRYSISPGSTGQPVYGAAIGQQTSLAGSEQTLDQYRNIIIQTFLNYERTFGKGELTAMAMFNRDEITLFGPSGDPTNPTANSTDPYKHNNGAGRATYVYNKKYIAEFSASYMGSDPFPKGKQYGFFPAGSVGWIVSNENFLNRSKAINFLKLRGSYGVVGNDGIVPLGLSSRYSLYTQTFGSSGYIFGTGNTASGGLAEAVIANPNLTWEKERSANIGLDATLFGNFDLSVDLFNRDRHDILVASNSTIPQYLGVVTPTLNQGKSNNKGIEVALRYNSAAKKAFRYFIEGNLSYSKNKIIFNAEALQANKGLLSTGTRIGQPFGLKAIGFFTQAEVDARVQDPKRYPAPLTETIKAGDIKFGDIGGPDGKPDGIIDANDRMPIGNPFTPDLMAGLHAGFQYKGFDLDFVFQGATGNTVTLSGSYFYAFQGNGQIAPIALGRWTPQTAETATYPRLSSKDNLNNYQFSSFWQRDARFLKLRSAEIGYTLPAKWSGKAKLGGVRIFAEGTNLFSLDKISYGDPESLTGYPVLRTITGGVKINL